MMMLGCATPVVAQTHMDNPKFERRAEPVLGMNQQELRDALGKPKEVIEAGCAVPLVIGPNNKPIPVFGNAWVYRYSTDTRASSLVICVVNKHAIGEERTFGIKEGKRVYHTTQSLVDLDLLEKAFRGELDESSNEERTKPRHYDGPEYEI